MEIGEKGGERSQVACEEEIEGKQRKNKEIRGINNKNTLEHQFGAFCQFKFGIGLREENDTKRRREASNKRKDKENKDQERKGWIKKFQQEYLEVKGFLYDFLTCFGMHCIFMCIFSLFYVSGMDFTRF